MSNKINKNNKENGGGIVLDKKEAELVKNIVNAERDNLKSNIFVKQGRSDYEKSLDNLVVKFK